MPNSRLPEAPRPFFLLKGSQPNIPGGFTPIKQAPWEIQQWSAYLNERGADGDVATIEFFAKRVGKVGHDREAEKTWFDHLDSDDQITFGGMA